MPTVERYSRHYTLILRTIQYCIPNFPIPTKYTNVTMRILLERVCVNNSQVTKLVK